MARILELIPGTDGEIRVAKLKTTKGELKRSLQKLVPMEIKSSQEEFTMDKAARIKMRNFKEPVIPKVKKRSKFKNRENSGKQDEQCKSLEIITRYGRKVKTPIRFK